jgi:hypothetical protein
VGTFSSRGPNSPTRTKLKLMWRKSGRAD